MGEANIFQVSLFQPVMLGERQDVLWVTVHGVQTAQSLRAGRRSIYDASLKSGSVFVTDYRKAVLLIGPQGLIDLTTGWVVPQPGAFLVTEPQLHTMVPYARRLLERGITRQVFTCRSEAFSWAEARADLARL
jgi:hypothetical protein